MKVLVLSCGTGEGHNSAAKAIIEELKLRNISSELKDILSFGNKKQEVIVKSFFNNIAIKSPKFFGMMYKAGDIVSNNKVKSPVYFANILYANKIKKYIEENKINIIICTHLFPMETLTYLKINNKIDIKCYGISTDYTAIPFIEETKLDGYFIPSEKLQKEFIDKKIRKDKIYSTGIPVLKKFSIGLEMKEARKYLKLDLDKKIILIMTGGMGCGNLVEIIDLLLRKTSDNVLFLVLTGKNKEKYESIMKRYNNAKVKPIEFTNDIHIYMKAADILITKPGGLSITEASVSNKPMINSFAIPGCETKNALFFEKYGMSFNGLDLNYLEEKIILLLNNKNKRDKMLSNQRKYINNNAAKDIVDIIINNFLE